MKYLAAAALLAAPTIAVGQPTSEAPSAVKTFETACLSGGLDASARPASLVGAGWTKDPSVSVNVAGLGISPAIDRNFNFSRPEAAEQWSGVVDGKDAKIVLAKFSEKDRYPHLCALVIDGINNAMPYANDIKAAFKTFGIGGKSVDLVHYFEFSGKIAADRHPVRGEIFSRSLASGNAKSMHIYVAY